MIGCLCLRMRGDSFAREPSTTRACRGRCNSEHTHTHTHTHTHGKGRYKTYIMCIIVNFVNAVFREVLAELSKIDRFNTIFTSHQHPPSLAGSCIDGRGQLVDGCGLLDEGCGHPAMSSFVRDALKRTEGVVQDIDRMLAS